MYKLENCNMTELKDMAIKMDLLPIKKNKSDIIKDITSAFEEYEEYKKEKLDKYKKQKQIGNEGKEGITYLVHGPRNKKFAMKTFRKTKSSGKLLQEFNLQKIASKNGIAPKVYDYDTVSKYIVMELMESHLIDYMKDKILSKDQQERIIEIFHILDKAKVYHNDANLYNYMMKGDQIYLIDYGFAREITDKLCKELNTTTPNYKLMTLGFVLKVIEMDLDRKNCKYIIRHIPKEERVKYGLS